MIAQMEKLARLIIVQFNSTNSSILPSWLPFNSEAPKKPGQNIPSGILIGGPIEGISIAEAIDNIGNLDYELVDAFRRQLPNPKDPRKKYNAAYFLFAPHQFAKPSEGFKRIRGNAFVELRKLTREAMWTTKVFNNPFFADDAEVPGERALVINCMARVPLFEDGKSVLVWPRGCSKDNPGTGKVPLQPSEGLQIRIESEVAQVVAA